MRIQYSRRWWLFRIPRNMLCVDLMAEYWATLDAFGSLFYLVIIIML